MPPSRSSHNSAAPHTTSDGEVPHRLLRLRRPVRCHLPGASNTFCCLFYLILPSLNMFYRLAIATELGAMSMLENRPPTFPRPYTWDDLGLSHWAGPCNMQPNQPKHGSGVIYNHGSPPLAPRWRSPLRCAAPPPRSTSRHRCSTLHLRPLRRSHSRLTAAVPIPWRLHH